MTGLLLIFVLLVWAAVSAAMAHAFTWRISSAALRATAAIVVFSALLVLPVLDEIIGVSQFSQLCETGASFRIGVEQTEGRSTKYSASPSNSLVDGTAIPMYHTHVRYSDIRTGETVVEFDRYVAKGGFLIQALGISEGNSPLLIDRPHCSPELGVAVHRTLKFSVVN